MLEAMRRNTKVILWITVIFFVLLIFLVWGADLQFGGAPQPNTLGRVNGEDITVVEYQQELANNRERARLQGRELQPSDELMLEEQTWNTIVERKLLYQEAQRRHLGARDSEVREILLNDPPPFITQNPNFQTEDGKFDFASYRRLIQDPTLPENVLIQLENDVRGYLPLEKLQNIILSSAKVTDDEVRRQYLEEYDKAVVSYVLIDATRAQVDENVSDEELEAYYAEHSEDYRLPRRVDLVYVSVPRRPTAEDSLSLRNDLAEMADEARQAEKLTTEGQDNLSYSSFETLAMTFSDAPNADQGGLSDGYLTPSEMSPAMARAVADLPKGGISQPFRDGASMHIVQVVDRKTEGDTPSVQIRDLSMRITPSDSTITATRDMLEEVRRHATAGDLASAAESAGLEVRTAEDVTPTGIVPGLSAVPQIADFAQTNPPGTVSRVYETNNAWYLVEVGDAEPEGIPLLADIRDRVANDVIRERRFEAVRPVADRIEGRLKMGEDLTAAAAPDDVPVTSSVEVSRRTGVPGLGRDADAVAAALTRNAGEYTEEPVRTNRGWVVLKVDERPEIDWTLFEQQKEQVRQSLLQRKQSQIYNSWLLDLKRNAKIEDFRS